MFLLAFLSLLLIPLRVCTVEDVSGIHPRFVHEFHTGLDSSRDFSGLACCTVNSPTSERDYGDLQVSHYYIY